MLAILWNVCIGIVLFHLFVECCCLFLECSTLRFPMVKLKSCVFGMSFQLSLIHSSVVNANNISLDAINNSDIIISNYTGYLQVLIYASRYDCSFILIIVFLIVSLSSPKMFLFSLLFIYRVWLLSVHSSLLFGIVCILHRMHSLRRERLLTNVIVTYLWSY